MINFVDDLQTIIKNFNLSGQWVFFFILVATVFITAVLLPKLMINLFAKVSISPIVIGTFLISIITSIPELISTVFFPIFSETTFSGEIKSFSNIFGANFLSLTVLCLLDFIFFRWFFFRSNTQIVKISGLLTIVFNLLFLFAISFPELFLNEQIPFLNISFFLVFLVLIYIIFLIWSHLKVPESYKNFLIRKRNFFKYRYSLFALGVVVLLLIYLLILSMLFLIVLANHFQQIYKISDYSVGGIVFAFITSSPEIWSMTAMFWMGFGGAAIGIIAGSHLINMLFLIFLDLRNGNQSFAQLSVESLIFLIFVTLLTSIVIFVRYFHFLSYKPSVYFLAPFLVIIIFTLGWGQILIK